MLIAWLWPTVVADQIANLQYALSTVAQAYAAILGILLTVGLAFTQLGDYRIPIPLLSRLSALEAVALAFAGSVVVLPVFALSFGVLELYRICFVLFLLGVAALPVFAGRLVRRTRPEFYVNRLLRAKSGWRLYGNSVLTVAIQAADRRDWTTLSMMVALLGQLREPDSANHIERGWGYQQNLSPLVAHLVENANDRGLRAVLGTVAYGACVTPTTSVLDMNETRGRIDNWFRLRWLVRPAWVHRVESRFVSAKPILTVPDSYDYGILMALTGWILELTHVRNDCPGEPTLPKRVSGFREWAGLVTKVVYSVYLLEEAAKDDPSVPCATSELWQLRAWRGMFGTVSPALLRDAVLRTPSFPGGFNMQFPLHFPADLQEKWKADRARLVPAQVRAANHLVRDAVERQYVANPNDTMRLFWPEWEIGEAGNVFATGRRFATLD